MPRRTLVSRPFLPRTSSSRASSAATSPLAATAASASVAQRLEVAGQVGEIHIRPSIGISITNI